VMALARHLLLAPVGALGAATEGNSRVASPRAHSFVQVHEE
jgi:hypothetical protein